MKMVRAVKAPDGGGTIQDRSSTESSRHTHFLSQKGRPRPLIVAAEFTWGTKPRGRGGGPT